MALIIGLTGSIASGKSTVSLMFDDFNIPVIDADKLARVVVMPGEKAYKEIVDTFGEEVLRDDKTIDRKRLGEIVFNDAEKREQLNQIVHPAVRNKMIAKKEEYVRAGTRCIVLDIPLMFESKLTHFADKTLVVYVDEDVQLERLMERDGFTKEEALARIRSQIPVKEKANMADAVIDNNGSKYDAYQQLNDLLKKWNVL